MAAAKGCFARSHTAWSIALAWPAQIPIRAGKTSKPPSANSERFQFPASWLKLLDGGGRGPVAPPVFKTGLAGIAFAGGFDSLPLPPTNSSACGDAFRRAHLDPLVDHSPAIFGRAKLRRQRFSVLDIPDLVIKPLELFGLHLAQSGLFLSQIYA